MIDTKQALQKTFGKNCFTDDPKVLESYASDESFVHALKPWYVVKPTTAAQVQELVQWANQTNTPLIPVSSGAPHFRGDTVPTATGAVIVDMTGMKKIVRIDKRNRMVLVEPGVTYTQLQPELAKAGFRISSPLKPRANKSVVGALIEREPIIIPRYQWAMLDPLRCIEVVWGDGNRMTTGEAGSLGSIEKEWEKKLAQVNPQGPMQADFYKIASGAQGSMGITTWASIKCEILPQIHHLFFAQSRKLENLLNLAYGILRIRFGDELLIVNNWMLASIMGKEANEIKALANQLPPWMLLVGIAGRTRLPEERVAYQKKNIAEMAQRDGLELVQAVPGASGVDVLKAILNPSEEPYWKMNYKGGCEEIFFLNTLEKSPEFVKAMYSVAEAKSYPTSEIGVYIQPVHQGASCHIEFDLYFDKNNPLEVSSMKDLYTAASEELFHKGAYYSRPYNIWANMAFNADYASTRVIKKIKGIFDPNNVLNPGKLCF